MPTPVILVDGAQPPPIGATANGLKALGANVALSLASTVGIFSLRWELVWAPPGSTSALGSTTPSAPFSTTLGPLDVRGTYLLKAIANDVDVAEFAIAVLTPTALLRVPARAEQGQWDPSSWWFSALSELVDAVEVLAAGGGGGGGAPSGPAGGSLTGTYPNPGIASGAVDTAQIADGGVTDAKLASGIDGAKLSAGSVAATQLASAAVEEAQLAAGAVVAGKLADGAVDTTARLADAIVTAAKLASTAVTDKLGFAPDLAGAAIATLTDANSTLSLAESSAGVVLVDATAWTATRIITWHADRPTRKTRYLYVQGDQDAEIRMRAIDTVVSIFAGVWYVLVDVADGNLVVRPLDRADVPGWLGDSHIAEGANIDGDKLAAGTVPVDRLESGDFGTTPIESGDAKAHSKSLTVDGGSTTDATPTALTSITIPDNSGGTILVLGIATKSDGSVVYTRAVKAAFAKVAGTLTLGTSVQADPDSVGTTTGMDFDLAASSNNVAPTATGLAATTFRWGYSYELDYRTTSA